MRAAALLLAAALAGCAAPRPALVARANGDSITLYAEPCAGNDLLTSYREGALVYGGRDYRACWRQEGRYAVVIDAAGDLQLAPLSAFEVER